MVPDNLRVADYVFVRHDAHCGPLRPPYDGPYQVLERGVKFFVLDMGGRPDRVSIDRLKPAHRDGNEPVELYQPPRRGRPPVAVPESLSPGPPRPLVDEKMQGKSDKSS